MPTRASRTLLAGALAAVCPGQERVSEAVPIAPTAHEQALRERGRRDLEAVVADALGRPTSFVGRVRFGTPLEPAAAAFVVDEQFEGGLDGPRAWFRVTGFTCLRHGERTVFSRDDGAWRKPRWDEPEVPLTPRMLLPHLLDADLGTPQPCMIDGRPAMRVHARFSGKSCKRVVMSTTVPSSNGEQTVEALATASSRNQVRYSVDATLAYDPAARRWVQATLRVACLEDKPIPDDILPPDAPAGMPHLPRFPMIEATWTLTRRDADELDVPQPDETARALLELPPRRSGG